MGWVVMSARELGRIEVLAQADDGRLSVEAGSGVLGLSRRQLFRPLARYRTEGAAAIRHRARGRAPNNRIHPAKRDHALALIREGYGLLRAYARGRGAGGASWAACLARDVADVDGGGRAVAAARAAPALPPAPSAAAATGRARPGRRLRAPLVRGPRAALHAAGVRGRRHEHPDAGALRALGDDVRLLRGARGGPEGPRPAGRARHRPRSDGGPWLALRQAHGGPPAQARPARQRDDRSLGRALAELRGEIPCANSRPGRRAVSSGRTARSRTGS